MVPGLLMKKDMALAEVEEHLARQGVAQFGTGHAAVLHNLLCVEVNHAAFCLLDDGHLDAAVLVGEDESGLLHVVVVAVVSAIANAGTAHLMVALPLVQATEMERRLAAWSARIDAAAEAEELVSLVEVEAHEADDGVVLIGFQEDVVLCGALDGEVAEQRCRRALQAAIGVAVGGEA